jgi:hypothetical protein
LDLLSINVRLMIEFVLLFCDINFGCCLSFEDWICYTVMWYQFSWTRRRRTADARWICCSASSRNWCTPGKKNCTECLCAPSASLNTRYIQSSYTECFLSPSGRRVLHSVLFVPSVYLAPSVSSKTLGTVYTECCLLRVDTRYTYPLPLHPFVMKRFVPSVTLCRVSWKHSVQVYYTEYFADAECKYELCRVTIYRV